MFCLLVCDEKGVQYLAKRLLSQGGYTIWGGYTMGGGVRYLGGGVYARNAVVSLNLRPFLLSHLKCGSHVELLEFVRGLECLQVKTRRTVPFLIDMKIFYALLKTSFGASYAPWHVDQFLLGHPLLYGV